LGRLRQARRGQRPRLLLVPARRRRRPGRLNRRSTRCRNGYDGGVPNLGQLERAVMERLWAADGPLTARAVQDGLATRDLAPTTVLTVLGRLERKGLVARERDGRAHHYRAVG